jgi:hypothetical protein
MFRINIRLISRFSIAVIISIYILLPCSFPQVKSTSYLENATISQIAGDGYNIWVATYGYGVCKYSLRHDRWVNFSTKNENLDNDLFYCIAVSRDYVWAGSTEGLYTYNKRRNTWAKKKFGLGGEMGNWIRSLCYDSDQNVLWIGRFKYLTRLDLNTMKYKDFDLTENNDAKTNTITVVKLDGDSLVWFGTESGVHIYEKDKDPSDSSAWRFINNKNDGFNNDGSAVSIHDILFDGDYVWFGTDEFITAQKPEFNIGGIYRFNRTYRWDRLSKQNGLPANGIYCLARTGNKIWAGLYYFDKNEKKEYGKGLVLIDRTSGKVSPVDLNTFNSASATISCFYFDGTDMWVGTNDGLYRIRVYNPLAVWTAKKELKPQRRKRR